MKKIVFAIFGISCLTIVACKNGQGDKSTEEKIVADTTLQAVAINSHNPDAFNTSFGQLLNSYYELKDALVASDSLKANSAAAKLALNADSLQVNTLVDSSGAIKSAAKTFTATISGSSLAVMGEKDLEQKRKEFQMISDAMYDLVRSVRYDKQKVYHQFCPMAFDNAGAFWLSNNEEIKNPYFGSKMLTCGEVKDVLDFAKK